MARLHGVDPESFAGTMEAFFACVHPDHVDALRAVVEHAAATGGSFITEFRVAVPEGATCWIQGRGAVIVDDDGSVARMVGLAMDATVLRTQHERAGRNLDMSSDGLIMVDPDWRISYANRAAARIFESTPTALLGTPIWDHYLGGVHTDVVRRLRSATVTGKFTRLREHFGALDSWFDLHLVPGSDGLTIFFRNVDTEVASEREHLDRAKRLQVAVERGQQLQEITARLAGAMTEQDVARIVHARLRGPLAPMLPASRCSTTSADISNSWPPIRC